MISSRLSKTVAFVLAGIISSTSSQSFAAEAIDINNKFSEIYNPEKPFDPYGTFIDLETGEVVLGDAIIGVPDRDGNFTRRVVARDYYRELNETQKKLNKHGLSLKDNAAVATTKEIPVNKPLLARQDEEAKKQVAPEDTQIMKPVRNPAQMAEDIEKEAREIGNQALQNIYSRSASSSDTMPAIPLNQLDPAVVRQPSSDLSNFLTKSWGVTKGEKEKFSVDASAKLELGGSLKKVQALASARSDVYVLGSEFNIVYAFVEGTLAREQGKFEKKLDYLVKFLGKDLYYPADRNSSAGGTGVQNNKKSPTPLASIKKGSEYYFVIGVVPVKVEIGLAGDMTLDWTAGISVFRATGGAQLVSRLGVFFSGAVTVFIAEAGLRGTVDLINDILTIDGYAGEQLDKVTGEPQIIAGVIGQNDLRVLSGRLVAYADYYVPAVAIPPWKKKSVEELLAEYPGFSTGKVILFNFQKVVRKGGFFLTGAPRKEDQTEVDVEAELQKSVSQTLGFIDGPVMRKAVADGQTTYNATQEIEKGVAALERDL